VRSANATNSAAAGAALVFALFMTGCKTTQQNADRLKLHNSRTLEGRKVVDVSATSPDVKVVRAEAVRGKEGGAIVVTLRNGADRSVSELPLEVGVRTGGGEMQVNGKDPSAERLYPENHAPPLEPGEETTWVFESDKPLPAGTAYAQVGPEPSIPDEEPGDSLPAIEAEANGPATASGPNSTLSVKITNNSDIPQFDIGVYAVVKKGNRAVAAGAAVLPHIGSNESATVAVPIDGDAAVGQFQVFVSPTYFK
jgi:hypothetical protein